MNDKDLYQFDLIDVTDLIRNLRCLGMFVTVTQPPHEL